MEIKDIVIENVNDIFESEYADTLGDMLLFLTNLAAKEVGTPFFKGALIERQFNTEELTVKVTYKGVLCKK